MPLAAVYQLQGQVLDDGWTVTTPVGWKIDPATGSVISNNDGSGGNFSAGYFVEKGTDGQKSTAFLKAIDLSRALGRPNVIQALQEIVATAAFEQNLLKMCGERKMDRVVLALATGEIEVGTNLQDRVPYIIFELANGDVRRRLRSVSETVKAAWILRAVHHATVGLSQLHAAEVAHQDVKPSNLLDFEGESVFKLGDVGRAVTRGAAVPHANLSIPGDPIYAPPELLYGWEHPDWRTRRMGCDLYLLGSLICFFFLGQGVTPLLVKHMEVQHRPRFFGGEWSGTYADALTFVRRAFSSVLAELDVVVPTSVKDDILTAVTQLCEPDPSLRGHPLNRSEMHVDQFGLERYVAQFDLLSKRAQVGARSKSV